MTEAKKRRLCVCLEESTAKKMEQTRDKTGVPVSKQVEMRLKGYTITSISRKGKPDDVLGFLNSEKDDELASKVEMTLEKTHSGFRVQKI